MSLFVNANGKIIVSPTNKPVECLDCPCDTLPIGDPFVYCVTKEFYAGAGCTGGHTTLEHQCMCMDPYCLSSWDKVAFCQGAVKYIYESGPHFIGCPNNCLPAVCPTDCTECLTAYSCNFTVTCLGCVVTETVSLDDRTGCVWSITSIPAGNCSTGHWQVNWDGCSVHCTGNQWILTIGITAFDSSYGYLGDCSFTLVRPAAPCPTGPIGSYIDGLGNGAIIY